MNDRPIEMARDADLRLSHQAMLRAAQRAREIAAQTGTAIVVCEHGVLRHIYPAKEQRSEGVRESRAAYNNES